MFDKKILNGGLLSMTDAKVLLGFEKPKDLQNSENNNL